MTAGGKNVGLERLNAPRPPSFPRSGNFLGLGVADASCATFFPPRGASCIPPGTPVQTAFEQTLGRPDVVIAVLDSGIEWNNAAAMVALRNKVHLNQGELRTGSGSGSGSALPPFTG